MRQDSTFKHRFSYAFMVEELVRWFVGDLHDTGELVDGLDFPGLERVPEQSKTGPSTDKRSYANDIVWRVPFPEVAEGTVPAASGADDRGPAAGR